MSIQLYKPNSKNTGSAFTFSIGVNKNNPLPAFYISAIAQHSWNDEKKIGSFSGNSKNPEKTVNVKINELECGEIMSAFKNRHDYSTFHSFDGNNTSIKFSPWDKDVKVSKYDPSSKSYKDEKEKVPAFGLSISKGKGNTFKIGLDPGEVEIMLKLLEMYVLKFIDAKIKQNEENRKNNYQKSDSSSKPIPSEPEGVDEDDDEDPPF
jgi:hypothetical protein